MKAAVFNEANQPLIIKEIDIEEPRSREVMVKISNCGICHSDLSMLDLGGAGQLPVILGHEAAGTIESIGSDVTSVKPGDKVLVTPLAFCGQCYWCARAEPTACVEAQSFTSGLRPDGTSPFCFIFCSIICRRFPHFTPPSILLCGISRITRLTRIHGGHLFIAWAQTLTSL